MLKALKLNLHIGIMSTAWLYSGIFSQAQSVAVSAAPIDNTHSTGFICDADRNDGVDIGLPVGTPVQARGSGIISQVIDNTQSGCGFSIDITYPNGYTENVAHMSTSNYLQGQKVTQGAIIGLSGKSSNAPLPYIHWTMKDPNGKWIDPRSVGSAPKSTAEFTEPEMLQKGIDYINASDETQSVKDIAINQLRSDYKAAREIKYDTYRKNLDLATDAWYANNKNWRKIPKTQWDKLTERDRGRFRNGLDPEKFLSSETATSSHP